MKFALEDVLESLNKAKIDQNQSQEVINYLEKLAEELAQEKEPRVKKEFVLLSKKITDDSVEAPCWLIQVEEGTDHSKISSNISEVIQNYKRSEKRNKKDVSTIDNAFLNIPKKDFSNFGINLKTKEPILIIQA